MINLLPPNDLQDIKVAKRSSVLRRYIELILVATVIIAVLVSGSYYYLKRQESNTQKTVELNNTKIEELGSVQEQAEQLSATVNTISLLLARDIKFSIILTDIGKLMPSGAVLTGLELTSADQEAPLVISAQVDTEQKAAILRNNLEASDLFERAEIKSITRIGEDSNSSGDADEKPSDSPYKYITVIEAYFAKEAK
jgi:hypothetical protein